MERLRRLWRQPREVVKPPSTSSVFFLRGHPRSGTNWVGALLNLHPRVSCTGEFHLDAIREAVRRLQSQSWHIVGREPVRSILDRGLADLVRQVLQATSKKPGATTLGDRSPHFLPAEDPGLIADAPYILTIRDGRDVLVSWRFHLLRQPMEVIKAVVPAPFQERFLMDAAGFRAAPNAAGMPPERVLADEEWVRFAAGRWANWVMHDQRVAARAESGEGPLKVQVVRYEELHADLEAQRARMYEFLGLDPSEAAPVSVETRTTAGFGREDNTSFFRHGEVGDWRTYASDDAKRWIKDAAGEALVALGYEKDANW